MLSNMHVCIGWYKSHRIHPLQCNRVTWCIYSHLSGWTSVYICVCLFNSGDINTEYIHCNHVTWCYQICIGWYKSHRIHLLQCNRVTWCIYSHLSGWTSVYVCVCLFNSGDINTEYIHCNHVTWCYPIHCNHVTWCYPMCMYALGDTNHTECTHCNHVT